MKKTQETANKKADLFQNYLEEHKIDAFAVEEVKDELASVVFRSHLAVGGAQLPVALTIDRSLYTMIRVQIAGRSIGERGCAAARPLLEKYNREYRPLKYYISEENEACLLCCLPSTEEHFDAELIGMMLQAIIEHLEQAYPQIMQKIWGQQPPEPADGD